MAFWEDKPLGELDTEEWEALCDGCGRCCLLKLEDADTGAVYYTDVACTLLDLGTCRCGDYAQRTRRVADCLVLTRDVVDSFAWLPQTCAYRLRAWGQPLPPWHPLRSGDPDSVRAAGVSACGFAIAEGRLPPGDDLEDHLLEGLG